MQIRLNDGSIIDALVNVDSSGNIIGGAGSGSGITPVLIKSLAGTNLINLKSTAGKLYGVQLCNTGATWVYVKLYDLAVLPVLATDVPKIIVGIPPGGRCEVNRPAGATFANGISLGLLGGVVDTDTTAIALSQVVGTIDIG